MILFIMNMTNEVFLNRLKTANIKSEDYTYNFLDVIKKGDNENIISEWLAFLFDVNKCGSMLPLTRFCEFLNIDYDNAEPKIEREYVLDNRRRIDILIKLNNAWIVVENKINSFECNAQTVDYETKIKTQTASQKIPLYYIYLKPAYNRSTPKNKNFKVITYRQLSEIWKDINLNNFIKKDNFIYFSEFMKLINNKYAMKNELRFDENTKLYIEFSKQFQAVEKSFDNACQSVKNKLLNLLNAEFPADEGWTVAPHSEFIQIYKTSWGNDLHFEIGTWAWQKIYKNISFNRLISDSVEITFCLHAERARTEKFKTKFKEIETMHDKLFCTEKYNLSDEEKCLSALNEIIERLHKIKLSIAPTIDKIINDGNYE